MMEYLVQFLLAMVATICFGLLFQVPRRHFLACGLTGAVGWLVYMLCSGPGGCSPAISTFLAVLPLTALSRFFAIYCKAPVTVFLLCGIFPLVPGAGIYYTAYYFLQDAQQLCVMKGVETIKIAVGMAIGIALVSSLPLPKKLRAANPGK